MLSESTAPRTDEKAGDAGEFMGDAEVVSASFARTLERELGEANEFKRCAKNTLNEMQSKLTSANALIERMAETIQDQPHSPRCNLNTPYPFGDKAREEWNKLKCNCWKAEPLTAYENYLKETK